MSSLTSRRKLRCLAVILVIASTGSLLGTAFAKEVKIGGTHTRGESPKSAGRLEGFPRIQGGKSRSYYCDNYDKDTYTKCDSKGKCSTTVPDRRAPAFRAPAAPVAF